MMKKNEGITLIALIVTIIILLILAGVTLNLTVGEDGILKETTSAVDLTKKAIIEEEISLAISEKTMKYYKERVTGTLETYLNMSWSTTSSSGVTISCDGNGNINYDGKTVASIDSTGKVTISDFIGGKTDTSKNRTLAGTTNGYSYKNPVIPQGFFAVNSGWEYTDNNQTEVKGWNDGLVIQDKIGNQFVWVPVDGAAVTYEKWCTDGWSYNQCSDATDTIVVDGITYSSIPVNERTQIDRYGGFYVARYEAGLPAGTISTNGDNNIYEKPVSKDNAEVWNFIDYTHAYVVAEKMISNSEIYGNNKSGLVTGTQWDTIVKWSGVGNNQKNIMNMEENIWELSSEVNYQNRVTRGNNVTAEGTKVTVAHRNSCGITQKWGDVGFRVVLYVE